MNESRISKSGHIFLRGLAVAITLAVVFVTFSRRARETKQCLAAGYPEFRRIVGNSYCVKRVNGTDSVVSITTILEEHGEK